MADPLNTTFKFSTSKKKEVELDDCIQEITLDEKLDDKSIKGLNNNSRLEEPVNVESPKSTTNHPQPDERVQEHLENVITNSTNLPEGIHLEDLDRGVQQQIKKDLQIEINGKQVPILEISHALFSQFTKTWQISDKSKNVQLPFITMVREPVAEIGTTNGTYYMPNNGQTYTVHSKQELIGGKEQTVNYKIAQPTYVDINYIVSLFCSRQRDINKLNERIIRLFQSRQRSVLVKGRYMPLILESITDASEQNLNERNYFKQMYQLKLQGYILDENDMEVTIGTKNVNLTLNVEENNKKEIYECIKGKCTPKSCPICFKYNFTKYTSSTCEIISTENVLITSINQKDDAPIQLILNGKQVNVPFMIKKGDSFIVEHGFECYKPRCIKLCGEKI